MNNNTLGDKLQFIRKDMGMSQKDFVEYLGLPRPSLSAYENNHNSPTVDVMINIANKYDIPLDWLCGISSAKHILSSLSDVADVLYALMETEDIKLDIEVHDQLPNDEETETEKWFTSITILGNDAKHKHNASLCNIIRNVINDYADLKSYSVSKEMYDLAKEKTKDYYTLPLKQKKFPELSREERMKKHMNYLSANNKRGKS